MTNLWGLFYKCNLPPNNSFLFFSFVTKVFGPLLEDEDFTSDDFGLADNMVKGSSATNVMNSVSHSPVIRLISQNCLFHFFLYSCSQIK